MNVSLFKQWKIIKLTWPFYRKKGTSYAHFDGNLGLDEDEQEINDFFDDDEEEVEEPKVEKKLNFKDRLLMNVEKINEKLNYLVNNQTILMDQVDLINDDILDIREEIDSIKLTMKLILIYQQSMTTVFKAVLELAKDDQGDSDDQAAFSDSSSKNASKSKKFLKK